MHTRLFSSCMLFSYSCTLIRTWELPGTTTALDSTSTVFTLSSHPSPLLSLSFSPSLHPPLSGSIQRRSEVTDVEALICRVQSWPLLGTQPHGNTLLYHPAVCVSRFVCERQTETVPGSACRCVETSYLGLWKKLNVYLVMYVWFCTSKREYVIKLGCLKPPAQSAITAIFNVDCMSHYARWV